jgi:plastocyanin
VGHRVLIAFLLMTGLAEPARADAVGRVTGKVTVVESDGKPAAEIDAIVYVVGFTEPPPVTSTMPKVTQHDRKFVPDLLAITAGETVSFPNDDPFLHNVFSQSPARKFDLGSFKRGDSKEKPFPDPGVVDVYCNIHPEMAATILVLPNRAHTRTASNGAFAIDSVPPGQWTVFAYTRRALRPVSAKISITAGAETTIELSLARGGDADHVNKYGEKYRPDGQSTYH